MSYILQPLIGEWTAWDDEARAEAEQVAMRPKLAVVWFCGGIETREIA